MCWVSSKKETSASKGRGSVLRCNLNVFERRSDIIFDIETKTLFGFETAEAWIKSIESAVILLTTIIDNNKTKGGDSMF